MGMQRRLYEGYTGGKAVVGPGEIKKWFLEWGAEMEGRKGGVMERFAC